KKNKIKKQNPVVCVCYDPHQKPQNRYTPRLKMAMPFLVLRIFRNKINGISKLVYSTLAIRVYGQGDLG
ncbi:MAG: hypothetical protein ACK400_16495, partial [Pseudanabaena sp.]